MLTKPEIEDRLRRTAYRFQRDFPKPQWFERQIIQSAAATPHRPNQAQPLFKELALACMLLVGAVGLGVAIANSRANTHGGPTSHSRSVGQRLPLADLQTAGVGNVADLVPEQDIKPATGGLGLIVIGAYADPARTVIIFRSTGKGGNVPNAAAAVICPPARPCPSYPPMARLFSISDSVGPINGSVSEAQVNTGNLGDSNLGDYVVFVDQGPHPLADGVAELTVSAGFPSSDANTASRAWTFQVPVKVQSAQEIPLPSPFVVGSWHVAMEKFEVTPTAVRVQALITGATPDDFLMKGRLNLLDPSGKLITGQFAQPLSSRADAPNGKQPPIGAPSVRVNFEWLKPPAGTYQIQFQAPDGTVHDVPVTIGGS